MNPYDLLVSVVALGLTLTVVGLAVEWWLDRRPRGPVPLSEFYAAMEKITDPTPIGTTSGEAFRAYNENATRRAIEMRTTLSAGQYRAFQRLFFPAGTVQNPSDPSPTPRFRLGR